VQSSPVASRGAEVFASSTAMVMVYDTDLNLVDANPAALEYLGVTLDDLIGRRGTEVFATFDLEGRRLGPEFLESIGLAGTLEAPATATVLIDLDGRGWRCVELNFGRLDVDGKRQGMVCSLVDVTDRHVALRRIRLFSALERLLAVTRDEPGLLQGLCDTLVEVGGWRLASIKVAGTDGAHSLQVDHAAGLTDYLAETDATWSPRLGSGTPATVALLTGVIQVVEDCASDERTASTREALERFGLRSAVALPFGIGWRWAVLTLYADTPGAFDAGAVELLSAIAADFGLALNTVRSAQASERQLEVVFSLLAETTTASDGAHARGTAAIAEALAHELELEAGLVTAIRRGALIHDLSVQVSDADLRTTLVARGTKVRDSGLPWPFPEIVEGCREHVDGSGLPLGLTGDQLCQPAKVVALANELDHHRRDDPGALDRLLRSWRATWFDAEVVDAARRLLADGRLEGIGAA